MRFCRRSLFTSLWFTCVSIALPAFAGERLYNGIVLPDAWPPKIERLTREPMPVPYLANRPEVVPIDVGRQLFVDDFLVEHTTLHRNYHMARYHPANPVLKPDRPWETTTKKEGPPRAIAMVFSDGVWYDPADKLFKMWYMIGACSATCYAFSKDGIYWEKPSLDVVPGTNIVLDEERDSTTVWIDQNERDPAKRYKMLAFLPPKGEPNRQTNPWRSALYFSKDGIHWGKPVATHPTDCDRTTFFYNPFRNLWVFSIRNYISWPIYRCRYYAETKTLGADYFEFMERGTPWASSDHLDPRHPNSEIKNTIPQLYNLDAIAYESITLGLFSIWQGQYDKSKGFNTGRQILAGFSRDGFHWSRPDRRVFAGNDETDGAWNWGNVQSAGGTCLIVGDHLYFYVSGRGKVAAKEPCSTGLAILRRDGFASMETGSEPGTLTTRPVTFKGRHLFVNADINDGELHVEVLDRDGKVLPGFSKADCIPATKNSTIQSVRWKESADLAAVSGKVVRFRFHLHHGRFFSFWVSPDESGASHGYVGAGGPGYTSPVDTVGKAALVAAADAAVQNICPTAPVIACPEWAKETAPIWVQPYLGKYGLPPPYPHQKAALGNCTAGIDMWQANHFVSYRAETASFLYGSYTPLKVNYRKGTFPMLEQIVERYTAGLTNDQQRALALLKRAVPELMAHPCIPPYSADCPPDRALSEEDLLRSGLGWCNEQARVFARLCQVAGIPARLIFLFYSDNDGHVITEFYTDGKWHMADASWGCVFPAADGQLMNAAECHANDANKDWVHKAYVARGHELLSESDDFLVGRRYLAVTNATEKAQKISENAHSLRAELQAGKSADKLAHKLWAFGVMNMPLPR